MPRPAPDINGSLSVPAQLEAPLAGMALAREGQLLVAWDTGHRLYVVDRQGAVVARRAFDRPLRSAAISDDGTTVCALPDGEEVWWLEPDLSERFRYRALPHGRVLALDATGWYLAVAASSSQNVIADSQGRRKAAFRTARPLALLEFSTEQAALVTCGEAGPLVAFDLDGERLWQNQLLGRYEGLAVSTDGILLAAPASGLFRFDLQGHSRGSLLRAAPPLRVSAAFDGARILLGRDNGEAQLIDAQGHPLWAATFDTPVFDVRLDLLAQRGWIGLADGRLARVEFA